MAEPGGRGGLVAFVTSIPGVLASLAAIATAVGSVYLGVHNDGTGASNPRGADQPAVTQTVTQAVSATTPSTAQTSEAPPPVIDTGAAAAVDQSDVDSVSGDSDASSNVVTSCEQGDRSACATLLYDLAVGCEQGNGMSCDDLSVLTAVGTPLHAYGATCGDRLPADDVTTCADR